MYHIFIAKLKWKRTTIFSKGVKHITLQWKHILSLEVINTSKVDGMHDKPNYNLSEYKNGIKIRKAINGFWFKIYHFRVVLESGRVFLK